MTAVGSGLSAQLIYADEQANSGSYGVAQALTYGTYGWPLEIKSETLELQKTTVQGQGLHAGGRYGRTARRVLTNYAIAGGIVLDLPTRYIGRLLTHMVGSFGYTALGPTELSTTGVYKSVHWPKSPYLQGHSLTIQKGVPTSDGTVEPFTYTGCKLSDWEISVATGALCQLTLTVMGRNELAGASTQGDSLNGSVPSLATFSTAPTSGAALSVFHFREATIFSGGTPTVTSNVVSLVGATALGHVRSASVKQSVSLDSSRYYVGGNGFRDEPIENGLAAITGQLVTEWLSGEALYEAFQTDTTTSLQITLTGPAVGTSGSNTELLDIIIPNIKLEGESPKVSGPQVVTTSNNFTGLDDETTTPIQIVYQSEDSTN
jgi:hypothetical protein